MTELVFKNCSENEIENTVLEILRVKLYPNHTFLNINFETIFFSDWSN